ILDNSDAEIESFKSKIAAKYDEIKQLTDEIEELRIEGDLTDDNAAKAISQLAASWANLAREHSNAAQQLAKLSGDQPSLAKKTADQFKAKMDGAIAAQKKPRQTAPGRSSKSGIRSRYIRRSPRG